MRTPSCASMSKYGGHVLETQPGSWMRMPGTRAPSSAGHSLAMVVVRILEPVRERAGRGRRRSRPPAPPRGCPGGPFASQKTRMRSQISCRRIWGTPSPPRDVRNTAPRQRQSPDSDMEADVRREVAPQPLGASTSRYPGSRRSGSPGAPARPRSARRAAASRSPRWPPAHALGSRRPGSGNNRRWTRRPPARRSAPGPGATWMAV